MHLTTLIFALVLPVTILADGKKEHDKDYSGGRRRPFPISGGYSFGGYTTGRGTGHGAGTGYPTATGHAYSTGTRSAESGYPTGTGSVESGYPTGTAYPSGETAPPGLYYKRSYDYEHEHEHEHDGYRHGKHGKYHQSNSYSSERPYPTGTGREGSPTGYHPTGTGAQGTRSYPTASGRPSGTYRGIRGGQRGY